MPNLWNSTEMTYELFFRFLKNRYKVLWLKLFFRITPLLFSFTVSIRWRNLCLVHSSFLAMTFTFSHSISPVQVDVCFASPPSFVLVGAILCFLHWSVVLLGVHYHDVPNVVFPICCVQCPKAQKSDFVIFFQTTDFI